MVSMSCCKQICQQSYKNVVSNCVNMMEAKVLVLSFSQPPVFLSNKTVREPMSWTINRNQGRGCNKNLLEHLYFFSTATTTEYGVTGKEKENPLLWEGDRPGATWQLTTVVLPHTHHNGRKTNRQNSARIEPERKLFLSELRWKRFTS